MGIKRCPKCGGTKLLARKITGVQVESLENGEFQINSEGKKYQIEIAGCAKCKANFEEAELVEMVQCNTCGKPVEPQYLDSNGKCDVCRALEEMPELVNMSKEDVIRMMLKTTRNTANTAPAVPVAQPVQTEAPAISSVAEAKMKAAQAAIDNVSDDFSKEIIADTEKELAETQEMINAMKEDSMNPPEIPTNGTEDKPKRKRGPRKKSDVEEKNETPAEEVTPEQMEQSADEMADLQEAPFPEQDNDIKEMLGENTVPQATVLNNQAPFQMFDEEQSF